MFKIPTAFASPVDSPSTNTGAAASSNSQGAWEKGTDQGNKFRDVGFAILYYIQLIIAIVLAGLYGPDVFENDDGEEDTDVENDSVYGYVYVAAILGAVTIALTALVFSTMTRIANTLIKFSLILSCVLAGVAALALLASGAMLGGIIGLVFFAILLCYARAVWPRIPFATANLVTAITAIRTNWGVVLVSFLMLVVSFGLTFIQAIAVAGVSKIKESCKTDEVTGEEECTNSGGAAIFFLLICYFWTQQVMKNTIHVTVAGTVGTWWVAPNEASTCCSKAVNDSFCRATTYSFGSICYGSLIVAILETIKTIVRSARNEEDGILLCLVDCILGCIEQLVEYFNKWAYIYVGLYGYSYCEAGKNVINLFRARGWDAIIADDLVDNALFFVCLSIGLVVGALGEGLYQATKDDWFENAATFDGANFLLGFLVGLFLSAILMSAISSATNAVIVLFAEAPAEFDRNHNQLSTEMRNAWLQVYPGCI